MKRVGREENTQDIYSGSTLESTSTVNQREIILIAGFFRSYITK